MNDTMQKEAAVKAFYAAIGAPVVTGRKFKAFGSRFATDTATAVDEWADEGRKLTGQIQDSKVVEQVQKMDMEQIQVQVEKLRDQLDTVLANWRSQFVPAPKSAPAVKVEVEKAAKPKAEKAAPKTAAAKKTTAKKTTPKATAAKKTTAKKTTPKTTPAE